MIFFGNTNRSIMLFLSIILSLLLISCGGSNNKSTSSLSSSSSGASSSSTINKHQVQYQASEGGSIEGESSQLIEPGHSSVTVTAKANEGYRFLHWSDGITSATRQENNVNSAFILTAFFTPYESTFYNYDLWIHQDAKLGQPLVTWPNLHLEGDVKINVAESVQDLIVGSYVFTQVTNLTQLGLTGLSPFKNYYMSLEHDNQVKARRSFYLGELGVNDLPTEFAISEDGTSYLSGNFTAAQFQYEQHGLFTLDPSTNLNSVPFAMPLIKGNVFTSLFDNKGGLYIAGDFTQIGVTPVNNFAYIADDGSIIGIDFLSNKSIKKILLDNDHLYIVSTDSSSPNISTISLIDADNLQLIQSIDAPGSISKLHATPNAIYAVGPNLFNSSPQLTIASANSKLGKFSKDLKDGGKTNILPSKLITDISSFTSTTGQSHLVLSSENSIYFLNESTNELMAPPSLSLNYESVFQSIVIKNNILFALHCVADFKDCVDENPQRQIISYDLDQEKTINQYNINLLGINKLYEVPKGLLLAPQDPTDNYFKDIYDRATTPTINLALLNTDNGSIVNLPLGGLDIHLSSNSNGVFHAIDRTNLALSGASSTIDKLIALSADKQSIKGMAKIQGGNINTLVFYEDVLYIGGDFNKINEQEREGLAAVDNNLQLITWPNRQQLRLQKNTSYDLPITINSIEINQDNFYVGGNFSVQSSPHINLIKLSADGNLMPFYTAINNTVNTIKSTAGAIYLGGHFTQLNNQSQISFGAVNHQGDLIPTPKLPIIPYDNPQNAYNPYWVEDIFIDNDRIFLGGHLIFNKSTSAISLTKDGVILPWAPITHDDLYSHFPPPPGAEANIVRSVLVDNNYVYLLGILSTHRYSPTIETPMIVSDLESNLIWSASFLENIQQIKKFYGEIYTLGKIKRGNRYIYGYSEFDLDSRLQEH